MFTLGDPDHPQELVDVVPGVPHDAPEDDEDVVHVQLGHDLVGPGLVGGHGLAHQGDVGVVPRVVVHQGGAVGHPGDLVAVVPPGHHGRVVGGVLPEPVVSFSEIVENVAPTEIQAK